MPALEKIRKKYIGDKAFYRVVLALIVPVIIQNTISNFVNLLDNLMVGSVGEAQMNGVAISNTLLFVFNLAIFGGMSGATIFGAQFFGAKDEDGMRFSFRFSLLVGAFVTILGVTVIGIFRRELLSLWINPVTEGTPEEFLAEALKAEQTLENGLKYLGVMLWGLAPFALTNAFAGMLRVSGETRLPMAASIASVGTNLCLNYILIFGHLGFPALGVQGAAIATVIARYVELAIIVSVSYWRLKKKGSYGFLRGAFKHFTIPSALFKNIFVKSLPLLLNELLWSVGISTLTRQYSLRGLTVVNANTITNTLTNLFNVFFISMGTASGVLVGRALGANDAEGARDNARKIIVFEEFVCLCTCTVLLITAGFLPMLYTKSSLEAKHLATRLIRVSGLVLPIQGFAHCTYFTLRAGGKTFITFLFDSVYTWLIPVPLAYLLVRFTPMGIVAIYGIVNAMEIIKDAIGYVLLKKGVWIQNIVT